MLPTRVKDSLDKLINYLDGLGVDTSKIQDKKLLLRAFIHKSFAADYEQNIPFNERLEFLWDSILWAIIAKRLFLDYKLPESKLTLYKVAMVKKENLAKVGKEIMLNNMIFLSKGEEKSWGRQSQAIIEDSLEALIGYIYLDMWEKEAEKFIMKNIYTKFDKDVSGDKNIKSLLQEVVQKLYKTLPEYKDYEHQKDTSGNVTLYKSEVYIQWEKKAEWLGQNKKQAQKDAASKAYDKLNEIDNKFSSISD